MHVHPTTTSSRDFLLSSALLDISALGKEVSALEELSQQLFLEYVDMHSLKVCQLHTQPCPQPSLHTHMREGAWVYIIQTVGHNCMYWRWLVYWLLHSSTTTHSIHSHLPSIPHTITSSLTAPTHTLTSSITPSVLLFMCVHVHVFMVQERIAYSKTLKGRYFDILGHFFSIYCIYKIFIVRVYTQQSCIMWVVWCFRLCLQCIINIIFDRVGKVGA